MSRLRAPIRNIGGGISEADGSHSLRHFGLRLKRYGSLNLGAPRSIDLIASTINVGGDTFELAVFRSGSKPGAQHLSMGDGIGSAHHQALDHSERRKRRRGPEPGTVERFGNADRALFAELGRLVADGMSVTGAAETLAEQGKVAGVGTATSRAKRLADLYRRESASSKTD